MNITQALTQIKVLLPQLSEREQKVIKFRFGLEDGNTHTLEETGKLFGVTRERVRQIEAKALEKMRNYQKELSTEEVLQNP